MPELLAAYVTPNDPTVIEPFFKLTFGFSSLRQKT